MVGRDTGARIGGTLRTAALPLPSSPVDVRLRAAGHDVPPLAAYDP